MQNNKLKEKLLDLLYLFVPSFDKNKYDAGIWPKPTGIELFLDKIS